MIGESIEVRDRRAIVAAAVDAAPVCVFVADADMRYLAVNAYACELLGYGEEELLQMRVPDIAAYEEAPQEYSELVESAYRRGVSRLRCRDGEQLLLDYVAGELEIDGQPVFVSVGTATFVSD